MASILKCDQIQSTTSNVIFSNSAGTEYGRFDASGNLGIGAASPTSITKFYVEQSSGNVLGYFNNTTASMNARLRINSTDNASSVAYVWSYSHASLNKQASMYLTSTGALAVQAGQTAGSEPTSGTTSAILNQYGIGLGGTNPSSGAGIAFPATQSASSDANTLDDYEEGTWTPSVGGTATYSQQGGTYTKIGRVVYISFILQIATIGTGSTNTITGIPFTGSGGWRNTMALSYWNTTNGALAYFTVYVGAGTSDMRCVATTGAATSVSDAYGALTSGTYIMGSGCYITA